MCHAVVCVYACAGLCVRNGPCCCGGEEMVAACVCLSAARRSGLAGGHRWHLTEPGTGDKPIKGARGQLHPSRCHHCRATRLKHQCWLEAAPALTSFSIPLFLLSVCLLMIFLPFFLSPFLCVILPTPSPRSLFQFCFSDSF